jgi:hypothetical protein
MSNPHIPPEILDHVVDHLHDAQDTLRNCCLVSKSWIPRTRKHIFANIKFQVVEDARSWKKTFPGPGNSPARYAKTLYFGPHVVPAADGEVGGLIRGFSRVERLEMDCRGSFPDGPSSLASFHGFSPAIISLRMTLAVPPPLWIFDLTLSFPLLKDLAVTTHTMSADNSDGSEDAPAAAQPSRPPMFTGSLELDLKGGMQHIIRRLLSLPGGIRFRKLTLTWYYVKDLSLIMALVEECHHTLESLNITWALLRESILHVRPHQ